MRPGVSADYQKQLGPVVTLQIMRRLTFLCTFVIVERLRGRTPDAEPLNKHHVNTLVRISSELAYRCDCITFHQSRTFVDKSVLKAALLAKPQNATTQKTYLKHEMNNDPYQLGSNNHNSGTQRQECIRPNHRQFLL